MGEARTKFKFSVIAPNGKTIDEALNSPEPVPLEMIKPIIQEWMVYKIAEGCSFDFAKNAEKFGNDVEFSEEEISKIHESAGIHVGILARMDAEGVTGHRFLTKEHLE